MVRNTKTCDKLSSTEKKVCTSSDVCSSSRLPRPSCLSSDRNLKVVERTRTHMDGRDRVSLPTPPRPSHRPLPNRPRAKSGKRERDGRASKGDASFDRTERGSLACLAPHCRASHRWKVFIFRCSLGYGLRIRIVGIFVSLRIVIVAAAMCTLF